MASKRAYRSPREPKKVSDQEPDRFAPGTYLPRVERDRIISDELADRGFRLSSRPRDYEGDRDPMED